MSSSGTSGVAELFAVLDYPMLVVTCPGSGCLVGFSTQVSIDPVRYLVCISKLNHTHHHALGSDVLAVHALDGEDRSLAEVFGELTGDEVDKLALVAWSPGPAGVPVLDDAAAWFVGRVIDRIDLGDHTGHLLEPLAGEVRRWRGQLGFQALKDLEPGHPA
jgi:flavin reductase (DIM6/NTAB) family NADH-FMN oxidoreductase RutF